MADTLTPVLTDNWDQDRAWTLAAYEERGGYDALKKALAKKRLEDNKRRRDEMQALVDMGEGKNP